MPRRCPRRRPPVRARIVFAARSTTRSPIATVAASDSSPETARARARMRASSSSIGERLRHVVVGAGVERVDLLGGVGAARQHEDRHLRPRPHGADDVDALDLRHAEVEQDEVGVRVRGEVDRLGAVARGDDLVAARAERDAQRALRAARRRRRGGSSCAPPLPVAAGSVTTIVSPPPGVSSTSRVPSIPSTKPFERARPRPRPVSLSVSPSRWNGMNTSSRRSAGMPGPRSTTRSSVRRRGTRSRRAAPARPAGVWRTAFARRFTTTRCRSTASASTGRQVVGQVELDRRPARRRARRAPGSTTSARSVGASVHGERAGLHAGSRRGGS